MMADTFVSLRFQATPVPPAPALSVEDRLKSVLNIQDDKKNVS